MPLLPLQDAGRVDGSGNVLRTITNLQTVDQNRRNALFNTMKLQEAQANAPVRKMESANALTNMEQDATLVMAHAVKQHLDANDVTGAKDFLRTMGERYQGTAVMPMITEGYDLLNKGDTQTVNDQATNIIRAMTPPEKNVTLAKGAVLVPPGGGPPIASNIQPDAPKAPEIRNDQNGVPRYASGPKTGEPVYPGVKKADTNTREARIKAFEDQLIAEGRDPREAHLAALNKEDRNVTYTPDVVGGGIIRTDLIHNTVSKVPSTDTPEAIPKPPPGGTLWDLAPAATGAVNSIVGNSAKALSVFGINPEQPTTEAQQVFKTSIQSMIRGLSINPRFPVAEQERIMKEVDIQPGFFTGVGELRRRMKGIKTALQTRLEQAKRDAGDQTLDVKTRQSQSANASALENFINIMGVPDDPTAGELDAIDARIKELEAKLGAQNGG